MPDSFFFRLLGTFASHFSHHYLPSQKASKQARIMLAMGVLQTLIFFSPKCKAAKASRACELVFLTRFWVFLFGLFLITIFLPQKAGKHASKILAMGVL
jgi:hypothetical protein